jgi:glycyl-tRNA synthetase beta subunit
VKDVVGEITYGLERIYTALTGTLKIADMNYGPSTAYKDVMQNEKEFSTFYFEESHFEDLQNEFQARQSLFENLLKKDLIEPAYETLIESSHLFNLMDARGLLTVVKRMNLISEIREQAKKLASRFSEDSLIKPLVSQVSTNSIGTLGSMDSPPNQSFSLWVELGFEDLPLSTLIDLESALPAWWKTFCKKISEETSHEDLLFSLKRSVFDFCFSPRRLTLTWSKLPAQIKQEEKEIKGPLESLALNENGEWTKIAYGFANKHQVPLSSLKIQESNGRKFLFTKVVQPEKNLLEEIWIDFVTFLEIFGVKKGMRWPFKKTEAVFQRPLRHLAAFWGEQFLNLSLWGVSAKPETFLVRPYFSKDKEKILSPKNTQSQQFILQKVETRFQNLCQQAKKQGIQQSKNLERFLKKSAYLVETPHLIVHPIPSKYAHLPKDLINAILQKDLNGFLVDEQSWILISENELNSSALLMVKSSLESRLEDGDFYLTQDLQKPLIHYKNASKQVEDPLSKGTIESKQKRLLQLCSLWGKEEKQWQEKFPKLTQQFNLDLTSRIVQEFPDVMTGLMDSLLAEQAQEDLEIIEALKSTPQPKTLTDQIPSSRLGLFLGLIQNFDHLACCFALGYRPSQNDPFKLRRAAITNLQRLGLFSQTSLHLPISLKTLIQEAFSVCPHPFDQKTSFELEMFFLQRAKAIWKESHMSSNLLQYGLKLLSSPLPVSEIRLVLENLSPILDSEEFHLFQQTFKRVSNLLKDPDTQFSTTKITEFESYIRKQKHELISLNEFLDHTRIFDSNPQVKEKNLSYLKKFWSTWQQFGPIQEL